MPFLSWVHRKLRQAKKNPNLEWKPIDVFKQQNATLYTVAEHEIKNDYLDNIAQNFCRLHATRFRAIYFDHTPMSQKLETLQLLTDKRFVYRNTLFNESYRKMISKQVWRIVTDSIPLNNRNIVDLIADYSHSWQDSNGWFKRNDCSFLRFRNGHRSMACFECWNNVSFHNHSKNYFVKFYNHHATRL
jgi:hypothetical protein